jgi:hypothetical protein
MHAMSVLLLFMTPGNQMPVSQGGEPVPHRCSPYFNVRIATLLLDVDLGAVMLCKFQFALALLVPDWWRFAMLARMLDESSQVDC